MAPICSKLLIILGSKRDSATRVSTSGYFHEPVSPWPQSIPLGPFKFFFYKFAEVIAAQGAPPESLTPLANGKRNSIRKIINVLFRHQWVKIDTFFP